MLTFGLWVTQIWSHPRIRVWVTAELWGAGAAVSPRARHGAGHVASRSCGDKGPIQEAPCAAAAFGRSESLVGDSGLAPLYAQLAWSPRPHPARAFVPPYPLLK